MKKKLGNPAVATAVASNPDLAKEVTQQVIRVKDETIKTTRILLVAGATAIVFWWGSKKFKEWRKQQFIQNNAHIPDVQAAMIFRKAMFKVEPMDFVFTTITIPDGTDEATLNSLATKVSSLANVVKAYKILFDGNLITDVYEELTNRELQRFFDRLNAKSEYDLGFGTGGQILPQTPFRAGATLVVKNPNGAPIYKAELVNGKYQRGALIEYKKFGERIGDIEKIYKSV
ncbi:MAG: hypothetical protein ACOVNR_06445, partial [Chitinophagaceae bacterium]